MNVAHQIGAALGLAVLVSAGAVGIHHLDGAALLAHRVTVAFSTATGMLALALVLVLTFIMRGGQMAEKRACASATS